MTNFYREKLVNAILFFARETNRLNMTKLSKLLHYFDFRHFAETGYPAIGLIYQSFHRGPVPKELWLELKDGERPYDFGDNLSITVKKDVGDPTWKEIEFKALADPDMSVFTPREKRILEQVSEIFKGSSGKLMSEASHQEGDPWDITVRQKGYNQDIDYILGLKEDFPLSKEEVEENLRDYFATLENFGVRPTE